MPYRFMKKESVADGLRRIAIEQIDKAIADSGLDDTAEAVHEVRKRCKKLRALIRLIRPVAGEIYRHENTCFRDAARNLSVLRDSTAVIETFDKLADCFSEQLDHRISSSARKALSAEKKDIHGELDINSKLKEFAVVMKNARKRAASWSLEAEECNAVEGGLEKTYRRGRNAMKNAYVKCSDEAFHEWRKRVKYHRYHMRLLRNVWKPVMKARREELITLSDLLGDDHDLAVLAKLIREEPDKFGSGPDVQILLELVRRRRARLRDKAKTLGARVYAEKPGNFRDRISACWKAWRGKK